jgi:hypothetical protein
MSGSSYFNGQMKLFDNKVFQKTIRVDNVKSDNLNTNSKYQVNNVEYISGGATVGGLACVYNPTTVQNIVIVGGFATINTVNTDNSNIFANGDIISVTNANNKLNDGIYEVSSYSSGVITINTTPAEAFCKKNFIVDVAPSGIVTRVNVGIIRVGTDGIWETASGSNIPLTYTDIGNLTGPASSTDNAVVRFDGTTGKFSQDTRGFTCDDNFNVKIGESTTNVDRCLHLQSRRDACIFIEADTDNNNPDENDNPNIVLQQDGGGVFASISMLDNGGEFDNDLVFRTSNISPNAGSIIFQTAGVHPPPATGTMVTSFTSPPITALKINDTDQHVVVYTGLEVDTINEKTSSAGVTVEGTKFENAGIDMTTLASNPGGANTVWQRTSDGHLLRGAVDLENTGGDVFGPASSTDNAIPRFDGITGKLIQDTVGFTCDDDFNVKIGNTSQAANRSLHIQGCQDACLFIEADTDNVTETDNPQIVIAQDGGLVWSSFGFGSSPSTNFNELILQTASFAPIGDNIVFKVAGQFATSTYTGIKERTFTKNPVTVLTLDGGLECVTVDTFLQTDTIQEKTSGAGVTVEGTKFENSGIDMTTLASNPGGANTVWQRTSDGHVLRGSIDLENTGGDVFGPASSTDNAIPRFDGITGKLIQDTVGFTCDDNFNVTIGDTTSNVDRTLRILGRQAACLFIEADTDNVNGTKNPAMVMSQDGGLVWSSIGFGSSPSPAFNDLIIQTASNGFQGDIVFKVAGEFVGSSFAGIKERTFTKDPVTVLTLDQGLECVTVDTFLQTDTIQEKTSGAGVTIEGTKFENSGIDMTTLASNPGGANTVWQRISDGHVFRGAVDLETSGGDVFGPVSSTDNAVSRFNGITGKLIQDTTGFTCDDNFNVTIGDTTSNVDRSLHIQGRQSVCVFIEADTDNTTETDNPVVVISQDRGAVWSSFGFGSETSTEFNDLILQLAEVPGRTDDIVFKVGGIFDNGVQYTGIKERTFIKDPVTVLTLDGGLECVTVNTFLRVDTINEFTSNTGVTIEGTKLENFGIDMTPVSSNPGGATTLWCNSSDSNRLYFGAIAIS